MRLPAILPIAGVLLQSLVNAASIPIIFDSTLTTRSELSAEQVRRELGQRVTKGTQIYGPNDNRYDAATNRWNRYAVPQIKVVVEPAQESDVSVIVKYCNQNSLPFLAINHHHGNSQSLGRFNGIQINMAGLDKIDIQPNKKTAWFQGGTYDGQVMRYLWERGYVATTGSCDCVGMMGPGLGGGHGRHEGLYGLISDNLVQLNVVLANGDAVRVSKTKNSDLHWAMKGAGHNFGIVTSFELNIYPRGPDRWHYHNYMWRGDKLEAIFTALNKFHNKGNTPVDMTANFGNFLMNTSVSTTEPVIWWTFAYRGTAKDAEKLLAPFNKIATVYEEMGDVPYPEISVLQQTDENSFVCQQGYTRTTSTAGLQAYNLTAERRIFDAFTRRVKSNPALAAGGVILHEGYSTKGVRAQKPEDSAYPFRDDYHLMLAQILVPENDKEMQQAGWDWVKEVRDEWNRGQPGRKPSTYVNYANGYESLDSMYGYETWRLKRLRDLKAKYDPLNRFGFYNPIVGKPVQGPI